MRSFAHMPFGISDRNSLFAHHLEGLVRVSQFENHWNKGIVFNWRKNGWCVWVKVAPNFFKGKYVVVVFYRDAIIIVAFFL